MTQGFVPYRPEEVSPEDGLVRVRRFREWMDGRRTVRSGTRYAEGSA